MTVITDAAENVAGAGVSGSGRVRRLTGGDKIVLGLMVGVPTLLHVALVWVPTLVSILLSFSQWDGIGGLATIKWVGVQNYTTMFTVSPTFWPAVQHNIIWLVFFVLLPTPFGMFLAYQLDKSIRFTRFYQTAIFLPVVISAAVTGFIWQTIYDPDNGLVNSILGTNKPGTSYIEWLGDSHLNLWAVLVAASWRQAAYIMILYLAGLKGFDPALREAAALDGATEWQAFTRVTFPALRPINIIILVVTIIESLRAFDLVYVVAGTNGTKPGLELLSILIANNILGESSLVGYGSALAVVLLVISLVPIVSYVFQTFRKDQQA
ncbi:carbohydrate ABC transporter permease [Kutzneria buriramensis]|uniref:Multiple sugar transport system permease protein/raffinose/stachyose/melibiose transport system permease protein n=1 Tax=Kutzneria buriramensis TaxID=1045776 RepID=A0A3E0HBC5_9PSEU|nr:sugar ABC transporter permease [Kutzneria buriramensis]REH41735.1 multiple sugar transport system permease protein/raffinose/stachyose/melibiose transport system permease protein [Kutzneria buriramensis]